MTNLRILPLLLIAAAACRTTEDFTPARRAKLARDVTKDWSQGARLTAAQLMVEYGPPDAIAAGAVAWKDKPPWRRIVVWDAPLGGNLEETIAYRVPESKRAALRGLEGLVRVSADGAELSAQSTAEQTNFLALNVADDVVSGRMHPSDARPFYDRTVDLAASGKTSRYLRGLMFLGRRTQ